MNSKAECRKWAELLREKANEIDDAELKAECESLATAFLCLADQFEQDMDSGNEQSRPKDRTAA